MAVKLDRYAAVALRPVKGPVEQRRSLLFERALGLVLEWVALHRDELLENWALAREKQPLKRIAPLE